MRPGWVRSPSAAPEGDPMTVKKFLQVLNEGGIVEDSSGVRWRLVDHTFMTSTNLGTTWHRGGYLEYTLSTIDYAFIVV